MLEVPEECTLLLHARCARKVIWMVGGPSQIWIQKHLPTPSPIPSSSGLGPWGRWATSRGLGFLTGQCCLPVRMRGCASLRELCEFSEDGGVPDSGVFVFSLPRTV